MILNVEYPTIEHPNYRYNENKYRIINVPLIEFPKNAPDVREIRLNNVNNPAIIHSLERYFSSSDDVLKYSKNIRRKAFDKIEKTKEQSETILFLSMYSFMIFIIFIVWYILLR